MSSNRINVFSLFSGAGGMDLGFSLSNRFSLLLANDILPDPARTYAENFHHKVARTDEISSNSSFPLYLLGDIAEVNFDLFSTANPDVMVGGPPCQDFSVVRGPQIERQGIAVKRGRLYAHFIRALIHTQPKIFVFENVPGLKSANKSSAYKVILEDFSKLDIRWKEIRKIVGNSFINNVKNYEIVFSDIIDSAYLGVPQKRRRLIIIGVREDLIEDEWTKRSINSKAENILLGKSSLLRKYPLTPLEVFEGLPLPELNDEYKRIMKEYEGIAEAVGTQKAVDWKNRIWQNLSFDVIKDYLKVNNISPSLGIEIDKAFEEHTKILKKLGYYQNKIEDKIFADKSNDRPNESDRVLERMRMIPPDENCEFVKGTKWEVEGRGLSLIYRRLHPLKPSYTVVAYGGGGTWGYHYRRERARLTNRERARLQTFPDSFTFKGNNAKVRAQIGEAVPPLLGEKIAELVSTVIKTNLT